MSHALLLLMIPWLAPVPQERTTPQDRPLPPSASAPAAAPATQPAAPRKPRQAEDLDQLLRAQEVRPILPAASGTPVASPAVRNGADRQLWVDGTMLERSGKLVRRDGRSWFEFASEDAGATMRQMEIERNQWLESMEREADQGVVEFIVTAEVTRYRGNNYLILRKVIRRVPNQNLTP